MAGDQADDLAARCLSGSDARGAVLEDQNVAGTALQAERLQTHNVALGIGLAVINTLSRDEVLRRSQVEHVEPTSYEGFRTGCYDGPRATLGDYSIDQRAGAMDLGRIVAVELRDLAFETADICYRSLLALQRSRPAKGRPRLTVPVRLFGGKNLEHVDTPTAMGSLEDRLGRNADVVSDSRFHTKG